MKKFFSPATTMVCAATIVALFHPVAMWADASASSQLSFFNVSVTPGSGTFVLLTNWQASAYAQATVAAQFNSGLAATANALGDFSSAAGQADASALNSQSSASGSVIGQVGADNASGQGWLFTWFMITGGSGNVNTVFSAQINGVLSVLTDAMCYN